MKIKIIKFFKPMFESDGRFWVNLQIEKVKSAKKNKEFIVLQLPEGYTEPKDPEDILKGKRSEKVFLFPDKPMVLVGTYYTLFNDETQKRIKADPYFWEYL